MKPKIPVNVESQIALLAQKIEVTQLNIKELVLRIEYLEGDLVFLKDQKEFLIIQKSNVESRNISDQIIEILEGEKGEPLHVDEILGRLNFRRSKPVGRSSIDSILSKDVRDPGSKLVRVKKAVYRLDNSDEEI